MIDAKRIEEWIHARIDGELSAAHAAELEAALDADPELAALARALEQVDAWGGDLLEPLSAADEAAALERVRAGVEAELAPAAGRVLGFPGIGRTAAAAALLVGAGAGFWLLVRGDAGAGSEPAPEVARAPEIVSVGEVAMGPPAEPPIGEPELPSTKQPSERTEPTEARPSATPSELLAAAGAGSLDGPGLERLLDQLDAIGLGGHRGAELAQERFDSDDAALAELRAAAALLALDGGARSLRLLEGALGDPGRAELAAGALVAAGPRASRRLHAVLDDAEVGAIAALALAAGSAEDVELVLARLDAQRDAQLAAALTEAAPEVLDRVLERAEYGPSLVALAASVERPAALELLVRTARERELERASLAALLARGDPAGHRAVLELLEYGQVERDTVEGLLRAPEFDASALLSTARELDSPSDRRWRAALLGLLVETPVPGSEPALLALCAADDLPQDQRLLGLLACAAFDGAPSPETRSALLGFLAGCRRDDARLAACALVALALRDGLDAALGPFVLQRSADRLREAIAPFSVDADPRRAFTASDVSRVARALENHLPLRTDTDS